MIPLSPSLLIASAGVLIANGRPGARPPSVPGPSRDAAFVHQAGYWSHFDHRGGRSSWPLPTGVSCDELARFATEMQVLSETRPRPGDVFLFWSPAKRRFVHSGIILSVDREDRWHGEPARYECQTMEGYVTATGCIGGDLLARVRRTIAPDRGDRLIQWTELDRRGASVRRAA